MKSTRLRSTCVRSLAILFLAVGLQGCNRDTPEKFIASGKSYLEKRDLPAAAIQFKNAVQKAPNNGEARYLLGITLQQGDDPIAAEIELRKALSAGYAPDLVYPAVVRALLEQRQFEKALSEAESQQNSNAAKAELSALIGDAQFGLGKLTEARAAYSAALSVEPSNDTATLGMAKVAALERDTARANQLVDEILARSPSSRDALLLKADLLLADKRGKDAAQLYAKAIDIRPYGLRVYLTLVPLLVHEQDLAGARARVDALKKLVPRAPATFYLDALVAYAQKDRARARDAIQSALQATPDFVPAMLLAGAIAHDSGNYAEAEEYLRKVVGATPNQAYPRRVLVSAYLRSGQVERAQEALDPLLQLAPNDPMVLGLAGEVALANRDIAKAGEYYKKALALDPKNTMMRTRLGQARVAAGDTQSGIQELEAASSEAGSQGQADVALLVVHLSRKELDKAQAASDELTKKQPNNPLTYNLAGLVRLAKGDQAGARKSFEHALELQPTYFPAARNLSLLDIRDRNPAAARQRYESILVKDPKNEQALLALVQLLQTSGVPTAEIDKAIERAIAAAPASPRARLLKINYLLQRNDAKAALSAAQQAQAAFPQDLQVLAALAQAESAAGETDHAIATFGKLASLMPKSPAPLLAQGQAYASAKDWVRARQSIQKALELQPDLVSGRVGLVRIGIQSGRLEEARTEARAIEQRWPMQAIGYLMETEVLTAQKEWGEVERLLRAAIEKTKNPALVIRLYGVLDGQGRKREAEAFASAWAAQNPKDILVDTYAGEMSMQRKDYVAAVRWYRNVLKAQPNNAIVLNNLAWALGQLHDPGALEYGQKALSLAPDAPAVLDTVGWLYVERGDVPRGLELLKKAHDLAPNTSSIQLNLAKALVKAGQGQAARQQLEILAKLPAGSPIRDEAEKLLSSL
jgi:putative PEP-CTERM system TPR-repeat lipoprotein